MYRCSVCGEFCVVFFEDVDAGICQWTHDENSPFESHYHTPIPELLLIG